MYAGFFFKGVLQFFASLHVKVDLRPVLPAGKHIQSHTLLQIKYAALAAGAEDIIEAAQHLEASIPGWSLSCAARPALQN